MNKREAIELIKSRKKRCDSNTEKNWLDAIETFLIDHISNNDLISKTSYPKINGLIMQPNRVMVVANTPYIIFVKDVESDEYYIYI